MAKDKKLVEGITSMDVDFAQWYTDVVKKAELCDYTSVKGCMVIKPAGYAIWENIQKELDRRFKETGVENVYLPMLIPESLLQKEKDHVEGFAPEVAWVTHGGLEPLQERMCIRPTSETLFCDFYQKEVHSYRDLPKVYNQWCSVLRWEKTTRPMAVRYMKNNQVSTNADSLVGKTVVVSEKIDNLAQSGKVNIADIEWMARSTDDLKIIPAGRKVKICSIEGVKLIVEEIKEEN